MDELIFKAYNEWKEINKFKKRHPQSKKGLQTAGKTRSITQVPTKPEKMLSSYEQFKQELAAKKAKKERDLAQLGERIKPAIKEVERTGGVSNRIKVPTSTIHPASKLKEESVVIPEAPKSDIPEGDTAFSEVLREKGKLPVVSEQSVEEPVEPQVTKPKKFGRPKRIMNFSLEPNPSITFTHGDVPQTNVSPSTFNVMTQDRKSSAGRKLGQIAKPSVEKAWKEYNSNDKEGKTFMNEDAIDESVRQIGIKYNKPKKQTVPDVEKAYQRYFSRHEEHGDDEDLEPQFVCENCGDEKTEASYDRKSKKMMCDKCGKEVWMKSRR